MKKSVDDILSNSQDVIGSSLTQAYTALTTGTPLQRSPSPSRKNVPPGSPPSHNSPPNTTNANPIVNEIDREKEKERERDKDKDSSGGYSSSNKSTKLSKSDSHLTPNFTCPDNLDSLSKSSYGSGILSDIKDEKLQGIPVERSKSSKNLSERAKKTPWYNALYPSYKARTEDFKKLFKVPDEERLIVDYSCAIQKDILVHGRLYVSQNFFCFHANIMYMWETRLQIRWKDVTAITKEKTARVIPNAILICTENDKHFLTSFTSRDKAYLMLFRVWQNALMDKPMNLQEIWQWVRL